MALQALFMDSRGNLPMTQEKPVTGFSGRFMAVCYAVLSDFLLFSSS
jgi:hypothetical protein